MLVNALISVIYSLFNIVFGFVHLPSFPDGVSSYLNAFQVYFKSGIRLLSVVINMSYVATLFTIFISLVVIFELYKFIMWVLKKIPILGIK